MPPQFFLTSNFPYSETLAFFDFSSQFELGLGYQFATYTPRHYIPRLSTHQIEEIDLLILNGQIYIPRDTFRLIIDGDKEAIGILEHLIQLSNQSAPSDVDTGLHPSATYLDPEGTWSNRADRNRFDAFIGPTPNSTRSAGRSRTRAIQSVLPPFTDTTGPSDVFIRISAFRNDLRIAPDGSLPSGTYSTSYFDFTAVPNAFAAVGRYALPNPVPPVHLFEIRPPAGTPILVGTVRPFYRQAGGGTEVVFQNALPAGSVVYAGVIRPW